MKAPQPSGPRQYETRDANAPAIAWTGAALAMGITLCLVTAALLYRGHSRLSAAARPDMSFHHGPDEIPEIAAVRITTDATAAEHLATYAWVDRDAGVVRIPLDRAMALLAAQSAKTKQEPR